ncbi:MAG: TIGR00159 family protein [Chloroflexi bacterium]|nr:TIGR00159 family protein [Chloroflexota bacterium]
MSLQEVIWTLQTLPLDWQNILDILLVAAVFFLILQLARGTRALSLLRGIAVFLVIIALLSTLLNLQAFSWLLTRSLTVLAVAVPVIFQDELRLWLDRLGRVSFFNPNSLGEATGPIDAICDAARELSIRRQGALIVLERDVGVQEYVNTGVMTDAHVTSELLQTIFYPKTVLHDGAVIIRNGRIAASACTLPLSAVRNMPDPSMGLRHRAALGISEVSDSVTIVVSEESGRISVVEGGRFIRKLDADRLRKILNEYIRTQENVGPLRWIANQTNQFINRIRPKSRANQGQTKAS